MVATLLPSDGQIVERPSTIFHADRIVGNAFINRKPANQAKPSVQKDDPNFVSRVMNATRGIIDRATSWLGTRYRWGGSSKNGVDCSGFTRMVYKGEGIGLPHNARLQFKKGKPVARTAMIPGDLVFFNTRGPLSHVGIYIGHNKFVHAANPRRGVRVDSLDSSYYSRLFAGARRYKNIDLG
jgi:cell wall-associated NlpC family hydrolase